MLVKIKSSKDKFKFYNDKGKDITPEIVDKIGFRNLILTNVTGGIMAIEVLKDGYFKTEMKRDQVKKLLTGNGFEIA